MQAHTEITDALNPTILLQTFIAFAPYILGALAILISINLISWAIRSVAQNSVFWGGSVTGTFNNWRERKSFDGLPSRSPDDLIDEAWDKEKLRRRGW